MGPVQISFIVSHLHVFQGIHYFLICRSLQINFIINTESTALLVVFLLPHLAGPDAVLPGNFQDVHVNNTLGENKQA